MSRIQTNRFGSRRVEGAPRVNRFGSRPAEPREPATNNSKAFAPDELQSIASGPDARRASRASEIQQIRQQHGTPDTTVPTTEFAGEQVPTEALLNAANEQGTTVEAITQLGTDKGLAAAKFASTAPGQLVTRASNATLNTVGSLLTLGAELVGQGDSGLAKGLRKARTDRANFQELIERDSDIQAAVGERANKIINGVAETVPQILTAAAGPVTMFATLSATATEQGLQKADELELEGGERWAFGAASGVIEAGVTALFGKVAQKLGVTTLEESVSPGIRAAIGNLLGKTGAQKQLATVAKEVAGTFAEGGEEAVVSALQQTLAKVAGSDADFDWNEVLDSALTGAAARGSTGAVQALGQKLNKGLTKDKVTDTVQGAVAAESLAKSVADRKTADAKTVESRLPKSKEDVAAVEKLRDHFVKPKGKTGERGVRRATEFFDTASDSDLTKLSGNLSAKEFHAITGLTKTSKNFREAFRSAITTLGKITDTKNSTEAVVDETAQAVQSTAADVQATPPIETTNEAASQPATSEADNTATDPATVPPTETGEVATNDTPADTAAVQDSVEDVGTAAKRESVDRDRSAVDLTEIPDADRQGWQAALDQADANGVAKRSLGIAAGVLAEPRPLSDVETAGMVTAMAESKNRHAELSERLKTKDGDNATTVGEIAQIEAEFDAMTKAMRASGTETGRALAARKLTIDRNFDLLSVVQRATTTKTEPLTDAQKSQFKELTDEIAKLEKQLAIAKTDDDKVSVEFKLDKLQTKINRNTAKLRPKTFANTAMDWFGRTVNTGRALRTSADLPPVLRQGFFFAMSRPVMSGRNAFKAAKTLFNPELAFKMTREIENRPNAALYKQAGLFIADPRSATPGKREEQYMENWFETLEDTPAGRFLKPAQTLVEASERNYTTFLNLMRADAFDALAGTLGKNGAPNVEQAKSLAFFVNTATGRGGFAKFDKAMTESAKVFFAPRYTLSRFQVLTGAPAFNANDAATRKIIAAEYGKTMLGTTIFLGLAKAAFQDEVEIELDPTSPDFLKMKFGDTRLDPVGGFSQTARFLARAAAGASNTFLGTEFENPATNSSLTRFGRSKLNPLFSGAFEATTGEDFNGQDISPLQIAANQVLPLSLTDIGGALEDQGMEKGAALWLASLWGIGLQTYEKKRGRSISFRQRGGRSSTSFRGRNSRRKQRGRSR